MKQSRRFIRKTLLALLIGILATGCQLKKREMGSGDQPVSPVVQAGAGSVRASKNQKFLVQASMDSLTAGVNNIVSYSVVISTLSKPSADLVIEAIYRQPDVSGESKAVAKVEELGRYVLTYDISKEGLWEVRLQFLEGGAPVDEITYLYTVTRLPDETKATKKGKFFVRASAEKLTGGEENTLTYAVATASLSPAVGITIDAVYWMPSMPEMGKFNATGVSKVPGQFTLSYDISMGGRWENILTLRENGSPVDEIVYQYKVDE